MRKTLVQLWRTIVGRLWSRLKSEKVLLSVKQFFELAREAFRKVVARLKASVRKGAEGRRRFHAIRPEEIRQVVQSHWQLRYNELDNNIELRPVADRQADFRPLDERSHNSLVMTVQNRLPQCYRSWVDCYLFSAEVEAYHPLRHYLEGLPAWDGHDYVGEVARQVSPDAQWAWVFRRWMRAMVSGWLGGGADTCVFQNQLAPLLVSERQGLGKSTFCRSLLPPVLRRYYLDKYDIHAESHAEQRLATMALINMDEFDRYSERQMGTLKNLMQLTEVTLRRPHVLHTEAHGLVHRHEQLRRTAHRPHGLAPLLLSDGDTVRGCRAGAPRAALCAAAGRDCGGRARHLLEGGGGSDRAPQCAVLP